MRGDRGHLEINVLGAWQTTQAFLPLLRCSAHPRVGMVSGDGGSLGPWAAGHPAHHAVCPGWVATDMGGPGGRPVEDGAASIMYAVHLPDDGPTRTFTRDGRPVPW